MRKISKDMIIADLVTIDPNIVVILMRAGMHCIGCPSAQGETLEEAAPADDYPEGDPFAKEEPLESTRRINLDDLKFGRNYTGE